MRMVIKLNTVSKENVYRLFLVIWSSGALLPVIFSVFQKIPIIGLTYSVVNVCFWLIFILLSFSEIKASIRPIDLLFFILCCLVVVFQLLSDSVYVGQLHDIWTDIMFKSIPLFFLGLALDFSFLNNVDSKKYKHFMWLTYVNLIADIVFYLRYSSTQSDIYTYVENGTNIRYTSFMFFAYITIPHVMALFYDFYKRKNLLSVVFAILGTLVVLTQGTRGAVICIVVYLAIILWDRVLNMKLWLRLLIFSLIVLLIVSIIRFNLVELIALALRNYAYNMGLSTRVFDSILQANYINDSGRSQIYSEILSTVSKGGIWGYGLTSDTYLFSTYSHNFVLELIVEFGFIIGSIIALITIIVFSLGMYKSSKRNINLNPVFAMFFCLGFVKLFMSGTYLTEPWFFFLIGFSIQIIRKSVRLEQMDNDYEKDISADFNV